MPRERVPLMERARADVAAGRLWKARDRLTGYLQQHPADQDALGLLGEVYLAMGDEPAAGRALMLTEREDEQARRAIAAFEERYGSLAARIQALGVRVPFDRWPPAVRARLETLRERARAQGLHWIEDRPGSPHELLPGRWWDDIVALSFLFLILIAPWVVGLVVILLWIVGVLR